MASTSAARLRPWARGTPFAVFYAVLLGGCAQDIDDVADVVARSERVLIYSDGERAAATTRDLQELDRYIACVESHFERADGQGRYTLLLNEDIEDWSCRAGTPGCYGDKARVAVVDFSKSDASVPDIGDTVRHELVHAVAHRSRFRAPTYFEEGRASQLAYACGPQVVDFTFGPSPDLSFDFDALLEDPSRDAYLTTRKITAALWRSSEGRELIERLSDELPTDAAADRVRDRYAALAGEDIADTWARVRGDVVTISPSPSIEASAVSPSTDPVLVVLEIEGDGPGELLLMADAFATDWRQHQSAIRLDEPGRYRITASVAATQTPRLIFAPLDCPGLEGGLTLSDGAAESLELEACTYALDFLGPVGSRASIELAAQ